MDKECALMNLLIIAIKMPLREPERAKLMELSRFFGLVPNKLVELIEEVKQMSELEVTQCIYGNEDKKWHFRARVYQVGPKLTLLTPNRPKGRTLRQQEIFPEKFNPKFGRRKPKIDKKIFYHRQPKPAWVTKEIIRLKALMQEAGCRKIAHTFNRKFAQSKQIT